MKSMSWELKLLLCVLLCVTGSNGLADDLAVDRTRRQVEMLDDLYKTVVVLITEHYVKDPSILSAASAAKALFAAMEEKEWHEVRSVGFTDIIFNPEHKPKDEFERAAAAKMSAAVTTHEEVVSEEGKRFLRYATPLPVVMEKCAMCHVNFKDNKNVIGSLVFKVPVID